MEFLDTQIISYKFKGNVELFDGDIKGKYLSSIVALEFLGIMKKDHGAKIYPCELSFRDFEEFPIEYYRILKHSPNRELGKNTTDKLIIDFNGEFDSIVIYSNEAISRLINRKARRTLLLFAYAAFNKVEYKKFKQRLDFLLDNDMHIVPITPSVVDKMHQTYDEIKNDYNVKDDYRNSFMDLLIVATAIEHRGKLISKDKELNKALKKCCIGLEMETIKEGIVSISSREDSFQCLRRNDAKGYCYCSASMASQ